MHRRLSSESGPSDRSRPLTPTVEDKDAGLVGISSGFDLKAYPVIAVGLFPVTDPSIKDAGDRRLASSMSAYFESELVRRLRESGVFARVVNLTETPWQPGAEKAPDRGRDHAPRRGLPGRPRVLRPLRRGKARAQSDMRFVDADTGQPVMVTADRRVAQMGFFGGDSKDHLKESLDDMARDLAKFLVRLSRGEALRKE